MSSHFQTFTRLRWPEQVSTFLKSHRKYIRQFTLFLLLLITKYHGLIRLYATLLYDHSVIIITFVNGRGAIQWGSLKRAGD